MSLLEILKVYLQVIPKPKEEDTLLYYSWVMLKFRLDLDSREYLTIPEKLITMNYIHHDLENT